MSTYGEPEDTTQEFDIAKLNARIAEIAAPENELYAKIDTISAGPEHVECSL